MDDTTAAWRGRGGAVWSFDPFTPGSCCWDPLEGSERWGFALRQGKWFADAAGHSQHSHVAEFWGQEAAKLLAPLLHAAAIAGSSIGEVIGRLDAQDGDAPVKVIADGGDPAAQVQLEGVLGLDPAQPRHDLHVGEQSACGLPLSRGARHRAPRLHPRAAARRRRPTLYVTASSRHQRSTQAAALGSPRPGTSRLVRAPVKRTRRRR